MKIIHWLLIIIVALIALFFLYLSYLGIFNELAVKEQELGPLTYVFQPYVGDYRGSGQVFNRVYQAIKNEGIETYKGIGIYYDDPKIVPKEKLRSDCGVVLEDKDLPKVNVLKKKYHLATLPKKLYIVAAFPLRNALSFMIGPAKGYPALAKYARSKGYEMTCPFELYDMPGGQIYYVMELKKQRAAR